ncbi:MAG: ethanolamine ammonia-lyase reactivating factor EutA [Rubrivivax sp.]
MSEEAAGGRVFFSNVRRSLEFEDEITLISVGVDIGSSTSHLVFSRLRLERLDSRYVVAERTVVHESAVLLTPYAADDTIDAQALGRFIDEQYAIAGVRPEQIDSGALILTGVAVRRRNARAIGELFAAQAGRLVAVSAGDALETTLAAFGSGAVARSIRESARVVNVDIGGGTSKLAVCEAGSVAAQTALDIGARIVCLDAQGRALRVEEAGRRLALEVGLELQVGQVPDAAGLDRLVQRMAGHLFEALRGGPPDTATAGLLRLEPLPAGLAPQVLTFSGGVAEYLYGRETRSHGDLGAALARAVLQRAQGWGPRLEPPDQGIRATVVGASQYTLQVSGSTIFVEPHSALPVRNLPVITPDLPLHEEVLEPAAISAAIGQALRRMGLTDTQEPVVMCYRWQGSATFARLHAFCQGVSAGLRPRLAQDAPLILVGDGDIGGLVGIHLHTELKLPHPVVSIDGIVLQEFDFIDIGELLDTSGAVPVVIKSLVFPSSSALGRAGPGPAPAAAAPAGPHGGL